METTNKKFKRVSSVTAVLIAIVILLTGTFAWQSISQEALNETAGLVNPGGRLHDDFDGTNKDVYVENFTDPATGGQPIYARIRLDEYMEVGAGAGLKEGDEGYADKTAESKVAGASINDQSSWTTHIPGDENDPFHEYFQWKTGGSTVYMPTFNKNKDSLTADINGTYEGTTTGDDTHYDDYTAYTDGQTKTADAVYDADDNDEDEGASAVEGTNIKTVSEEHAAKATQTATVMTMDEWKAAGSVPGPYWVYDKDGWAYWAQAIQPGEATGLLLDGITEKGEPGGKWYYGINVVAQFVTADDIGSDQNPVGFFSSDAGGKPTDDAMTLLDKATSTTTVKGEDGNTYISCKDNTFRMINADGTAGDLICGGADGKPGTSDDVTAIVVLDTENPTYGSKFLGPDPEDGSYMAAGPDKKLGTSDDIKVWAADGSDLSAGITENNPNA